MTTRGAIAGVFVGAGVVLAALDAHKASVVWTVIDIICVVINARLMISEMKR